MQIQPYTPKDLATASAGADRIQVPAGGALTPAGPQPPSLVQVFGREVWKRKRLLAVWAVVTLVVVGVVVSTFAKPVYRAEGRLSYRPNYAAGGPRPIYTPPNIQSAVQILKAQDVFEPVREKHLPGMSADEFARNVRVELARQSEFIDVSFDHPNPAVAAAVANDLMDVGQKYFTNVRVKSTTDAVAQVGRDLMQAKKDLERAKDDYRNAYEAKDIANPEVELDTLKTALSEIGSQLRQARSHQFDLKVKIDYLETKQKAPRGTSDDAIDEQFYNELSARIAGLQQRMMDEQTLQSAKIEADKLRDEAERMWPLVKKGVFQKIDYEAIIAKLRQQEAILKTAEETKAEREALKKQLEEFQARTKNGKRIPRAEQDQLQQLRLEQTALPGQIETLQEEQRQKRQDLARLNQLMRELGPKDEEIRLLRVRMQDLDAQLAAGRGQDPYANDLRVHAAAATGNTPYSTNASKLGLALAGASALLFVGYMSLFGLPKGTLTGPAGVGGLPNTPGGGLLPRALVALVPYTQKGQAPGNQPGLNGTAADGMSPGSPPASTEAAAPMSTPSKAPRADRIPVAEPAGNAEPIAVAEPEPVRALAERLIEEKVDRGGIVLFAPTDEELRLAPAIGDLGRYFTARGDRVLVFDARQAAEAPPWVQAPGVAASVAGFLSGQAERATECFVPTSLSGVEYSQVDLSKRVSGVLEARRFQELVEQMRERYSVVFLVGPPVTLDDDHPLLASMAEGMVLVTETAADPVEVHAYLDTLCQQVPARLYGTLAVPKAAA
jgi:uncharacterized protein involved in exopolysaccharide biosynthesis